MFKNFEVAAAGCAPVVDSIGELHDLGFDHGRNALVYTSFDELVDLSRWARSDPDAARRIGAAAEKLAWSHHTWAHRGETMVKMLQTLVEEGLDAARAVPPLLDSRLVH